MESNFFKFMEMASNTLPPKELKSNLPTLVTQEYYDSFNLAIEVKQKAIEALQEKTEREQGCEWCDYFTKSENLISLGNGQYKEVPHKYCGNCGKEL